MTLACDDPQAADGSCECGEISARGLQQNDTVLNDTVLNDTVLNDTVLNSTVLNKRWTNGARLDAAVLGDLNGPAYVQLLSVRMDGSTQDVVASWLEGSKLVVQPVNGAPLSGNQLDSAKLKFEIKEDGVKYRKIIKVVDAGRSAPGSDLWLYDLMVKVGDGLWTPLCLDHDGNPTEAILLNDVWEPTSGTRLNGGGSGSLTFACRGGALAKCVEWGYRPWASSGGQSLRDYHQACTRLVRADYCGDGTPHTQPGTPVHVLDQLGIQNLEPNLAFEIEAEWGPNGAVCLNPAHLRLGPQQLSCQLPACGAPFASGGLIQSGTPVAGP